jgi:hypothetical protein
MDGGGLVAGGFVRGLEKELGHPERYHFLLSRERSITTSLDTSGEVLKNSTRDCFIECFSSLGLPASNDGSFWPVLL